MAANLAVRRWWTIMPIVFITYSLAYLDRANYGFAAAAGINQDLGVSKGLSSLIGALFFLGYFFFQIPGAIYAERRSVKKLVFASLVPDVPDLVTFLGGAKIAPPACDKAAWVFLGLSMAGWNALASLGLTALSLLAVRHEKRKPS